MSVNEQQRLKALHTSNLLDSPSSPTLDSLLLLAKHLFEVEIVAVSLIDESRQWFKAQIGLDIEKTSRKTSFCTHTIEKESHFLVNDASNHELFHNNPLVINTPFIRFYSGIPLLSALGYKFGSFCIIDKKVRAFSEADLILQKKLALLIENELNRLSKIPFSDKPEPELVNQAMIKALHVFLTTDDKKLTFETMLKHMLELTQSSFGFIAEVNGEVGDQYLEMKAMTDTALNKPNKKVYDTHGKTGLKFYELDNLLGQPLRTFDPVIQNKGNVGLPATALPIEFPEIESYCSIPIMSGNEVIGLLGMANRKEEYSTAFINAIHPITLTTGILIQRNRAVQERNAYSQKIDEITYLNELTHLPNRRSLELHINSKVHLSLGSEPFTLCYLDIDDFALINQQFGTELGNRVLKTIAVRLSNMVGEDDFLAHVNGDEFVILLKHPQEGCFEKFINALQAPFVFGSETITLTGSVGVATFPKDGREIETLIRHADQAMYSAKQSGKNRHALFDVNSHNEKQYNLVVVQKVMQALEKSQIVPFLQAKVSLSDSSVIGYEALCRWQHPEKGVLAPGLFLPYIQNTHAQIAIDDYMFSESANILNVLHKFDTALTLNINISAEYFTSHEFLLRVESFSTKHPHLVPYLVLEIVESTALGELSLAAEKLKEIKKLGFAISLDDFGTGYSSLTYFRALPVDEVKIDKTFVDDILEDPLDQSIVQAIIDVSRAFSRGVVAEGVETNEQFIQLKKMGCSAAQGYFFAKPMSLADVILSLEKSA